MRNEFMELEEARLLKIDRPKRRLRDDLAPYIPIAKIVIVAAILLMGIATINYLDKVMDNQQMILKTQADCMDQIMDLRMELDMEYTIPDSPFPEYPNYIPVPEIVDSSEFILTDEERDLIERIVASEARGEPVEGMAAVAQVIRDRATSWGMTVTEVCLAPGQFATPYSGEISPEVVQAVWAVFDEGMSVLEVPTTHFHAEYVSPYWTSSKVSRGQIGSHRFYGGL